MNKRRGVWSSPIVCIILCVLLVTVSMLNPAIPAYAESNPYVMGGQYVNGDPHEKIRCTYVAWQEAYNRLGIALPAWSNAGGWFEKASGLYETGYEPRVDSIVVYGGGEWGHCAYVIGVSDGYITVIEGGTDLIDNSYEKSIGIDTRPGAVGSTWGPLYIIGYIYLTSASIHVPEPTLPPIDARAIYEAQIIENANNLLTETRPDLYKTIYGYITYITNRQLYYQRTLNDAESYKLAYDFEIEWGSRAIGLLIDAAVGNYNSTFADVTSDLVSSSVSEAISATRDQIKNELIHVKPDELIYSIAKSGAMHIQTADLFDIYDRMVDGKIVDFNDAVTFIRIHQENEASLAAAQMGWAYYMDTLQMSTFDHLKNLLVQTLISKLGSYTISSAGGGFIVEEAWSIVQSMLDDVLSVVGDLYDKDYVSTWQNSVREISAETIRLMGGSALSRENPLATYLSEIYPRTYERYEGNEGDTCVFNLDKNGLAGKDGYSRNGNIGINGEIFENGFEVWLARWNARDEQSWVRTVYPLYGMYTALSGHTGLIQSYNTNHFDTTVSFYDDDRELASYRLTPENYQHEINVDLTGVQLLTLYVTDNIAVSGGTSFALSDLRLAPSDRVSDISTSREVVPSPRPTIEPAPTIEQPSIFIEDTYIPKETPPVTPPVVMPESTQEMSGSDNSAFIVTDDAIIAAPQGLFDNFGFDFSDESGYAYFSVTSWEETFEDFVMNGQYLNRSEPYYVDSDYSRPCFGLYDFDKDGTPELIAFNGAEIYAEKAYYVYSSVNGTIVYLGNIYARDGGFFSVDDPLSPGLFVKNYQGGEEWVNYFSLVGDSFEWKEELNEDDPLYLLSLDESRHKYVAFFTDNEILYSLGWDGFVRGYSSE